MEAGSGQHHEELVLGSHIDGLSDEFAFAIEDKGLRNAVDVELLGDLSACVEQNGWMIAGRGDVGGDLEWFSSEMERMTRPWDWK